MGNSWCQAYTALTDFIGEHPEVEVGASAVSIPENIRPKFYGLFDAVRTAFVEEKFPGLLSKARTLSEGYTKVEKEVIKLLGLEGISSPRGLYIFLHNPEHALIRGLYDPLFDLLKVKVNIETFDKNGSRIVERPFRDLFRSGYERWVVLTLLKLMVPDKNFNSLLRLLFRRRLSRKLFRVPVHGRVNDDDNPHRGDIEMLVGESAKLVQPPEETKHLSFNLDDKLMTPFIVPDFIVHSTKVNRYISLRSEVCNAFLTASNASEEGEWYSIDSMVALEPGLTLIYLADKAEDIALIADAQKICRPDLIIECMEQEDWCKREKLEKVKLHHGSLKPKLGTYIVSREPVSEKDLGQLEEGINMLTVGFDQSKLEPIISVLMSQRSEICYGKS